MSVSPIQPVGLPTPSIAPASSSSSSGSAGFGETLGEMIKSIESTGAQANDAVSRMISGEGDVHTALIALQNADTTFQLSVQVRNKIVQAYQDIMRMPV